MSGVTQVNPGRNLAATINQGFQMMAGRDVPNYTLLFLDSTKKHKAGEHKNYIVQHLEIGRGSGCDIQYDDSYSTVSRKHASISIVDKNFILKHHPNASNPTFVNNQIVQEHKLQNGDEIQFSENGPKLRFNVSTLKTSTMGFTARMAFWGKQALRPYRYAVAILGFLLLGTIAYAVISNMNTKEQLAATDEEIKATQDSIEQVKRQNEERVAELEAIYADRIAMVQQQIENTAADNVAERRRLQERIRQLQEEREAAIDSTTEDGISVVNNGLSDSEVAKLLPASGIYIIRAKNIEKPLAEDVNVKGFTITKDSNVEINEQSLWTGTGFLTEDGKLVTARHVIQPWRYRQNLDREINGEKTYLEMNILESHLGMDVDVTFEAEDQQGNKIPFKYSDFRLGDSQDRREGFSLSEEGEVYIKLANLDSSDWAYMTTNRKGAINYDRELPGKLQRGDKLYSWGYSRGESTQTTTTPSPFFGSMTVSKVVEGDKLIYTGSRSFTQGNSGGPIFAIVGDKPVVVGIVSASWDNQGLIVPISQIY